jgi:hypothetical protein
MTHLIFGIAMNWELKRDGMEEDKHWQKQGYEAFIPLFQKSMNSFQFLYASMWQDSTFKASIFFGVRLFNMIAIRCVRKMLLWPCK